MNLDLLEKESFESFLNSGLFKLSDWGPLHGPVNSFELKRDEKHRLILVAHSAGTSQRDSKQFPDVASGAIYSNDATATFLGADMRVIANGVHPFSLNRYNDPLTKARSTCEKASIDTIELIPAQEGEVHQMLEWVDNLDTSLYIFPHSLEEERRIAVTRTLGGAEVPVVQHANAKESSFRRCLRLIVGECEIFIVPLRKQKDERPSGPAVICYRGFVDDETRRRIRECLSFAFGLPLVYFGYSLFSVEFELLGFKAVTPYVADESLQHLLALPPAPVGHPSRHARWIDADVFSTTVNALFQHYEEIDFRQISWIYWHAVCSPTHSQPVQFGAGIELLEKAYRKINKGKYVTTLLDSSRAQLLADGFLKIVGTMELNAEEREILQNKASGLNSPPQKILNKRFFAALALGMSEKEIAAWQRRNDSAHGVSTTNGGASDLMRDISLLKNILHRLILSMTSASQFYVDCYSPNFPIRLISESVDGPERWKFEP